MKLKIILSFLVILAVETAIWGQKTPVDKSKMIFCNGKDLIDCEDVYIRVGLLAYRSNNGKLTFDFYFSSCSSNRVVDTSAREKTADKRFNAFVANTRLGELVDYKGNPAAFNELDLLNAMARLGYRLYKDEGDETQLTMSGTYASIICRYYIFERW